MGLDQDKLEKTLWQLNDQIEDLSNKLNNLLEIRENLLKENYENRYAFQTAIANQERQ